MGVSAKKQAETECWVLQDGHLPQEFKQGCDMVPLAASGKNTLLPGFMEAQVRLL